MNEKNVKDIDSFSQEMGEKLLKAQEQQELQKQLDQKERKQLLDDFYVKQLKYYNDPVIADANLEKFKKELEVLDMEYYTELFAFLTELLEEHDEEYDLLTDETKAMIEKARVDGKLRRPKSGVIKHD